MDSLTFELQIVLYFQLFLSANVRHTNRQEQQDALGAKALRISKKFNIRSLLYFRLLGKHKTRVARNLKTKSKKLKQKIKKKIVSFKNSFIFRVSGFAPPL